MPTPTPGRTVLYRLNADDAERINRRRADYTNNTKATSTGYMAHVGNQALEGAVCPAVVVRVWDDTGTVNLQVLLDGNDVLWATSRHEGNDVGQWSWPEVR